MWDSEEPLLRAAHVILYPKDVEMKERAKDYVFDSDDDHIDGVPQIRLETSKEYKETVQDDLVHDLSTKSMHGEWFRNLTSDISLRSSDWITKGYVDKRTEGYIFAAQEQALHTNWLKSRITSGEWDRACRKCKEFPKKVSHITSGCSKLAGSEYKKRHDRMGLRVYWEVCKRHGIKCCDKWYKEAPDKVRVSTCGKFAVWWDRKVETPKELEANRPDLILIDREKKHWTIIDFSIPMDINVESKEREKIEKYTPLAYEIRKMCGVTTKIIPLVVGALGAVSNNLEKNLSFLDIGYIQTCMQKSAVLGSSIILKKFLNS